MNQEASSDRLKSYLIHTLTDIDSKSPVSIIQRRKQFLSGKLETADVDDQPASMPEKSLSATQRRQTLQLLQKCRKDLWKYSHSELNQLLDQECKGDEPDLQILADKLRRVSDLRFRFDELAKRLGKHTYIVELLQTLATLPPKDAAGRREAEIRSLHQGLNRVALTEGSKIIRLEFPEIYQIEASFIDEIASYEKSKRWGFTPSFSPRNSFLTGWILLLIVSAIIRGLIRR